MNLRTHGVLLVCIGCLLGTAHLAQAESGVPWVGWVAISAPGEASLYILPDGSGPPLTQAMLFGGQTVDATVTAQLIDISGFPIPVFPREDMWLESETTTDAACPSGAVAFFWSDTNTDANGKTFFAAPWAGGGWTTGPIWFYLNGSRGQDPEGREHPPVSLRINSADINADGAVNLSDVALLAADYYGPYQYRSDFRWDGVINLSDLALFASGLGKNCP